LERRLPWVIGQRTRPNLVELSAPASKATSPLSKPSLGDARIPPTTAVLAGCVYLPREVFFCLFGFVFCCPFGFAGAVGGFAAPSGFGLLGDTLLLLWLRDSRRCAVLHGRRSAVNGWNAQANPPLA
jgi:hypothetical protein